MAVAWPGSGANAPERVFRIQIKPYGKEVIWLQGETLLEALMKRFYGRDGRSGFYGCRRGGCGACKARLAEGEVEHAAQYSRGALRDDERWRGFILPCQSRPVGDVTVELQEKTSPFYRLYVEQV